jgi:hypothetical protein
MVAIVVLVLLHVPPGSVFVNVEVNPIHIAKPPLTVPIVASAFTLIVALAVHPSVSVNVITEVPPPAPVTMPVSESTVATVVVPLLHLPAVVESDACVVSPWQIVVLLRTTLAGSGFTETTSLIEQPVGKV